MTLKITTPFAIPFAFAHYSNCKSLNQALRELFLLRESQGQQYANPKATMRITEGLYESRFDLFNWPEACVIQIREFVWASIGQLLNELGGQDAESLARISGHADAWFHVTRRGGYFALHNHPMASWSGVYCVDPGQDDSSPRDSGVLSFPHPNSNAGMFVDAALNKLKIPYSYSTREFRLQAGQLVLFPSWLMHQVTPFYGDGERITIAFNCWFTENQAQR